MSATADPREQHARHRQVLRCEPRRGGAHRVRIERRQLPLAGDDTPDDVEELFDRGGLRDDRIGLRERGGHRERGST